MKSFKDTFLGDAEKIVLKDDVVYYTTETTNGTEAIASKNMTTAEKFAEMMDNDGQNFEDFEDALD